MNRSSRRGNAFMLLLLLYNIVLSLGITLLYVRLFNTPYADFINTPWFAIVSQIASFMLPLALWLRATRAGLSDFLPNMRLGRVNIVFVVALSLCLQPAMMLLSSLSSLVFPNAVSGLLSDLRQYPLAVSIATVAITPALCEEITFRGYIQSQYEGVSIKKAVLVNGLFFGMMHMNAQQFLYAFVMGCVFAYMVYYTRSIRAAVLAHFSMNALQLLLNYALDASSGTGTSAPAAGMAEMARTVLYMAAVSLIFLPPVVILFRAFVTHNRQRNVKRDIYQALHAESIEPSDFDAADPGEAAPIKNAPRSGRVFDWYFGGAVLVYVLYIASLYI